MLRISKKADYAVFLLGAIARQGAYPGGAAADTVVSAQEIARQAGLNKSVVANLLKAFAKQGLLESVRGLKGGYRLVRAPSEISLGEMLEVVEGRFTLVDGVSATGWAGPSLTKPIPPALALAPSQHAGNGRPAEVRPAELKTGEHGHDCTLIGFCPSKNPMRLVHERISQLFRQIRLDELCSMTGARPSPTTSEPALAQ